MPKRKTVKVRLVVEMECDEKRDLIYDEPLEEALMGELMKVKTGLYENLLYGAIVSVERIAENPEGRPAKAGTRND